jgi:hypothetical protein
VLEIEFELALVVRSCVLDGLREVVEGFAGFFETGFDDFLVDGAELVCAFFFRAALYAARPGLNLRFAFGFGFAFFLDATCDLSCVHVLLSTGGPLGV